MRQRCPSSDSGPQLAPHCSSSELGGSRSVWAITAIATNTSTLTASSAVVTGPTPCPATGAWERKFERRTARQSGQSSGKSPTEKDANSRPQRAQFAMKNLRVA